MQCDYKWFYYIVERIECLNDEMDRYWIATILIGTVNSLFSPPHLEQVPLNFIMMWIQFYKVSLK